MRPRCSRQRSGLAARSQRPPKFRCTQCSAHGTREAFSRTECARSSARMIRGSQPNSSTLSVTKSTRPPRPLSRPSTKRATSRHSIVPTLHCLPSGFAGDASGSYARTAAKAPAPRHDDAYLQAPLNHDVVHGAECAGRHGHRSLHAAASQRGIHPFLKYVGQAVLVTNRSKPSSTTVPLRTQF